MGGAGASDVGVQVSLEKECEGVCAIPPCLGDDVEVRDLSSATPPLLWAAGNPEDTDIYINGLTLCGKLTKRHKR